MVYKSSGKILTLPVSLISSQSPILMPVLPYHLRVMDHSKDACTFLTSSSGLSVLLLGSSVISAHVKMRVAFRASSMESMD